MGELGLALLELRFREQRNTHHHGCETLFEKLLMVDVQFYIKFGLFSHSSNFDYRTRGGYFSSMLFLKIE
jgi:hypothetical protein